VAGNASEEELRRTDIMDVMAGLEPGHPRETKGRERSRPFFASVIASEAKQSMARQNGWHGLLRRLRSSQ
jgi:hypothetical protein